jgi:hypothetical protein
MDLQSSQGCLYWILGGCGVMAFIIIIVFATRSARGQNLQGHGQGCQCPVCKTPAQGG